MVEKNQKKLISKKTSNHCKISQKKSKNLDLYI